MDTLSPSSLPASDDFVSTEKSRFCFICAAEIQNYSQPEDENDEDEQSSSSTSWSVSGVSLELFLKGVDVFCEALRIERKPFPRDDEWKRFAELENFVRFICCRQCSNWLINLVSLHELMLSTKKRLEGHVHTIKNHILDSIEREDTPEIEYFDRSCIQFRKDVLRKVQEQSKETIQAQILACKTGTGPRVLISGKSNLSFEFKNVQKAKRSNRFTHPPTEKPSLKEEKVNVIQTDFIKREEDKSENSEDSLSFNRSFSCEDLSVSVPKDENDYTEAPQSPPDCPDSEKDSDFEYDPESESSSSSSSEDEEFIPDVKRSKTYS